MQMILYYISFEYISGHESKQAFEIFLLDLIADRLSNLQPPLANLLLRQQIAPDPPHGNLGPKILLPYRKIDGIHILIDVGYHQVLALTVVRTAPVPSREECVPDEDRFCFRVVGVVARSSTD